MPAMLSFTWEELQQVLTGLAATEAQKAKVAAMVSAVRKQQRSCSREELLEQLLVAAWLTQQEDGEQIMEEVKAAIRIH